MPTWKDKLPADAPKPKPGETMRAYYLRARRHIEQQSVQRLGDAMRELHPPPKKD
jgi:hypothetical protein